LSPGTESSLAQLVNGKRKAKEGRESGLTEIQSEMEEVNRDKSSLSLLVQELGRASNETRGQQAQDQQVAATFSAVRLLWMRYPGLRGFSSYSTVAAGFIGTET